jgi:hypothetical protein
MDRSLTKKGQAMACYDRHGTWLGRAKSFFCGIVLVAVGGQTTRFEASEVYVRDSYGLRQIRPEDCEDHQEQERGPFQPTVDRVIAAVTTSPPQETTWRIYPEF